MGQGDVIIMLYYFMTADVIKGKRALQLQGHNTEKVFSSFLIVFNLFSC